jgi:hypothetical protein
MREDGVERLGGCSGGGGSGPGSGAFGSTSIVPGTDAGHTVRVSVIGGFGEIPTPGTNSPCLLRLPSGGVNYATVQGQRDLVTFRVQ